MRRAQRSIAYIKLNKNKRFSGLLVPTIRTSRRSRDNDDYREPSSLVANEIGRNLLLWYKLSPGNEFLHDETADRDNCPIAVPEEDGETKKVNMETDEPKNRT